MGQTHYHPKCFTCTDCKEPLGTSKYYIINGKNYCGKCRAKFLENCTKCGKMIENETIRPKETGKPYCPECFCCTKCDIPLQGKYFNTEDGILCEECFAVRIQKLSKLASLALIALPQMRPFPIIFKHCAGHFWFWFLCHHNKNTEPTYVMEHLGVKQILRIAHLFDRISDNRGFQVN